MQEKDLLAGWRAEIAEGLKAGRLAWIGVRATLKGDELTPAELAGPAPRRGRVVAARCS